MVARPCASSSLQCHCPDVLLKVPDSSLILLVDPRPVILQGAGYAWQKRRRNGRSGRVTLRVPLRIYEPGENKWFLVEEASALKVSLWGGLVALKATVKRDQELFLVNQATGKRRSPR